MINNKTKVLAAIAVAAGLTVTGIGAVRAATNNNTRPNFMGNFVDVIAQKFNLNPTEVQKVFDEQLAQQKTQMDTNRQQSFTDRINKAVSDGKLTQDQANQILAEKSTIDAQIAALNGKTREEINSGMKQIMDSEKQWATNNNISQQYLMFRCGGPMMQRGQSRFEGAKFFNGRGREKSAAPHTK
ncbi:MAG: hypothetical protein V1652_04180 [bacterium]